MTKGDRVRLKDNLATLLTNRARHKKVNWNARRGTILAMSRTKVATILWDGRNSLDHWPEKALRPV